MELIIIIVVKLIYLLKFKILILYNLPCASTSTKSAFTPRQITTFLKSNTYFTITFLTFTLYANSINSTNFFVSF